MLSIYFVVCLFVHLHACFSFAAVVDLVVVIVVFLLSLFSCCCTVAAVVSFCFCFFSVLRLNSKLFLVFSFFPAFNTAIVFSL